MSTNWKFMKKHQDMQEAAKSARTAATAEIAGTFILVFGLIGAALLTSPPSNGIAAQPGTGIFGVAAALGVAAIVAGYAFGPLSGGHFNGAVTIGLALAGRFPWKMVPLYLAAQTLGAVAAVAAIRGLIAGGSSTLLSTASDSGFASNGFGSLSPGHFTLGTVALTEIIGTAILVTVVLRVSSKEQGTTAGPLVVGLTLTSLLLVTIPIDNASLNPTRSLATAIFGGGEWIGGVWAFLLFPVVGAALAAGLERLLFVGRIRHRATWVPLPKHATSNSPAAPLTPSRVSNADQLVSRFTTIAPVPLDPAGDRVW